MQHVSTPGRKLHETPDPGPGLTALVFGDSSRLRCNGEYDSHSDI